jgi:ubiquitin carboxyl-terminal hydrolase 5/13
MPFRSTSAAGPSRLSGACVPASPRARSRAEARAQKDAEEPPTKMTKIAIVADREEDAYEHTTELRCWACDPAHGRVPGERAPQKLVDGVLAALSAARQSEVQAWEEEITACEHTLALQQDAVGAIAPSGAAPLTRCMGLDAEGSPSRSRALPRV